MNMPTLKGLNNAIFEAKSYLRYLIDAAGPHGVHSPYVYELITRVLPDKRSFYVFDKIERLRSDLLADNRVITIVDLGAGSRVSSSSARRVRDIAASASQPPFSARLLFRLVQHLKPKSILELGTSLGITTAYLANAAANARVISIEGAPEIASIAVENHQRLGLSNIQVLSGAFSDKIPDAISSLGSVDFALIDGDHRYEPTMHYFNLLMHHCNDESVLVFDDIHWSPEMNKAWEEIRSNPSVSLSLDFFDFGVVFFRKGRVKEHFVLKKPR